jgi:uncharacterized protein (UPF0332 family)
MKPNQIDRDTEEAVRSKVLLDTGDADGACNRAYYAMFDAARAALLVSGHDVGRTHKGILCTFSDRLVKNGPVSKDMGRRLKHAETFRYVADYEGDPVHLDDAREIVGSAEAFISAMQTFMSNDDRHAQGEKP